MFTPQAPIARTVGTAPTPLCQAVRGRKSITLQNTGAALVYFGFSADVTATNGFQLSTGGAAVTLSKAENDPVEGYLYAIVASGTGTVVVSEA